MDKKIDNTEKEYLLLLWEENVCPECGNIIPEGKRVRSGTKSDGGFCSLDCYAKYYKSQLLERERNLQRILNQIRNN